MLVLGNNSKPGVQRWEALSALVVREVRDCLFPSAMPRLLAPWWSLMCSGDNLYFALRITVDHILTSHSKLSQPLWEANNSRITLALSAVSKRQCELGSSDRSFPRLCLSYSRTLIGKFVPTELRIPLDQSGK